jgi:hypothetical protein
MACSGRVLLYCLLRLCTSLVIDNTHISEKKFYCHLFTQSYASVGLILNYSENIKINEDV